MSQKKFVIALSSAVLPPGHTNIEDLNEGLVLFNSFAKDLAEVFQPGQEPTVYASSSEAMAVYQDLLNPMKSWTWHDPDEGIDYVVSGYHGLMHRLFITGYRHDFGAKQQQGQVLPVNENKASGTLALVEYDGAGGMPFNIANGLILADTKVWTQINMETAFHR